MTDAERERLGWLQTMTAQPGWEIFAQRAYEVIDSEHALAIGAGTPRDDRGECAAVYRVLLDLLGWPTREIKALTDKARQGEADG